MFKHIFFKKSLSLSSRPLQTMGNFMEVSKAGRKCLCVSRKIVLWSNHLDFIMLVPMLYSKLCNHITIYIWYTYIYIHTYICGICPGPYGHMAYSHMYSKYMCAYGQPPYGMHGMYGMVRIPPGFQVEEVGSLNNHTVRTIWADGHIIIRFRPYGHMVIWSYEETKLDSNTPIRRGRRIMDVINDRNDLISNFCKIILKNQI